LPAAASSTSSNAVRIRDIRAAACPSKSAAVASPMPMQPWTSILGHADLQRAFELARRLNPIYVAIRWYLDAPYCEPTSSWGRAMREAPARELRHWLARMDKMASGP
jgi:hypothetical protein